MMGLLKACSRSVHFGSAVVTQNRELRERFPRSLLTIFGTLVHLIGGYHKFLIVCKNLSQIFFVTSPKLGAWANPPYPQKNRSKNRRLQHCVKWNFWSQKKYVFCSSELRSCQIALKLRKMDSL